MDDIFSPTAFNDEHVAGKNDVTGSYLFVDGASFTKAAEDFLLPIIGPNIRPIISFRKLSEWYEKVFYYDAMPVISEHSTDLDKAKAAEKKRIFEALDEMPKFHVFEGEAHRRKRGLEQKQVDVRIAVDMLTHAHRRNMRRCTLITGDADFIPVVEAVVREGVFIEIHYPVGCTNQKLLRAASSRVALDHRRFSYLLTKDFKQMHNLKSLIGILNSPNSKRERIEGTI
jgi:uncharacterized LabA/DUF88 family protein